MRELLLLRSIMARLNLTLDEQTSRRLEKHALEARTRSATFARTLIQEGLDRREAIRRSRKLARDYVAGRGDARKLLRDLEAGPCESFGGTGAD